MSLREDLPDRDLITLALALGESEMGAQVLKAMEGLPGELAKPGGVHPSVTLAAMVQGILLLKGHLGRVSLYLTEVTEDRVPEEVAAQRLAMLEKVAPIVEQARKVTAGWDQEGASDA